MQERASLVFALHNYLSTRPGGGRHEHLTSLPSLKEFRPISPVSQKSVVNNWRKIQRHRKKKGKKNNPNLVISSFELNLSRRDLGYIGHACDHIFSFLSNSCLTSTVGALWLLACNTNCWLLLLPHFLLKSVSPLLGSPKLKDIIKYLQLKYSS